MSHIRRYFGTGLLVTLPIFFTLYFFYIIFRFIDNIWGKIINTYLIKHLGFSIPGLGILLGLFTVLLVGFIATNFFGKKIFRTIEEWFLKLPLVKRVYPAAKQVVDSIISKENRAFKKVVMVQYPSKGLWAIGFITNDTFEKAVEASGMDLMHVFIATTPSPLTGFLALIPKNEIKYLDISVEQGIKLIVSGGIVKPQ